MKFVIDPEKCTGCRLCETACTFAHYGDFGSRTSRVRVVKIEEKGIDYPVLCQRCNNPACVLACPTGALTQEPETGVIRVDKKLCVSCGACVEACPFGAINLHPEFRLPLVCDLCSGSPSCVRECPTGALSVVNADSNLSQTRLAAIAQLKRDAFAERMCRSMVRKWRDR